MPYMDGIEAVRAVHKVCRALRRAADARQFDDAFRRNTHLVESFNDALGNGVVAATRAKRRLAAAVVEHLESDAVSLGLRCGCGRHLLALLENDVVCDGTRVNWQSVVVSDAAQPGDVLDRDVELQQLQ